MKRYWLLVLIGAALMFGGFYWLEIRPAKIRADCSQFLTGKKDLAPDESRPGRINDNGSSSGRQEYEKCLLEKGIKN